MDTMRIHRQFFNNFITLSKNRNIVIYQIGIINRQELFDLCFNLFPDFDNIIFGYNQILKDYQIKFLLKLKKSLSEFDTNFQLKEMV